MNQRKIAEDYQRNINAQLAVLMQKIATPSGFLQYYYKILPRCKSQKSAFEIVNLLYYLVFDEEKYSSYNSFRQMKNKEFKN